MAQLMISGSKATNGRLQISGAKNAALPLMAACLLTKGEVKLKNVPKISDVDTMKAELKAFGVRVSGDGQTLVLNAENAKSEPDNEYNSTRGGFTVLGPLMARFSEAKVPLPGGCKIQTSGRPVDFHTDALKEMGAREVPHNQNCVWLKAEGGLQGANIHFPNVSVGATENITMAACLADGTTIITNAAVEPEVMDLVHMLKKMGANIEVDEQENMITIYGQRGFLNGTTHTVIPDRIEAGSYAIAAAISGGPLLLEMPPQSAEEMLSTVVQKLRQAGVQATWEDDGLLVERKGKIKPIGIITGPYPEFPTDLLPQWATLMTQAQGPSRIEDTIYNNRFEHLNELRDVSGRALFTKESDTVYNINGGAKLQGRRVKAKDLRGGFALILAGMASEGSTVVKDFNHVLRGYENIKEKLKQCGAKLREEELPRARGGYSGPS